MNNDTVNVNIRGNEFHQTPSSVLMEFGNVHFEGEITNFKTLRFSPDIFKCGKYIINKDSEQQVVYEGDFKNGLLSGQGRMVSPEGEKMGIFENGELVRGTIKRKDNVIFEL